MDNSSVAPSGSSPAAPVKSEGPSPSDEKVFLTPEQAESLLADGEYVHNFVSGGMMLIGCDYGRAAAIKAFRNAKQIEIGGESCKRMSHPIAVFDANDHLSFFAADMAKVEAFEAAVAKQEA